MHYRRMVIHSMFERMIDNCGFLLQIRLQLDYRELIRIRLGAYDLHRDLSKTSSMNSVMGNYLSFIAFRA